ncbi:hypothetical protein GQ457_03G004570 [Hibiscus cannabinus]
MVRLKGFVLTDEILSRGGGMVFDWWDEIDESEEWQRFIFYFLSASYAFVSIVALVQLCRIQLRVPEYGWTTQKVFHLMNFIVNGLRAVLFGFYKIVFLVQSKALEMVLLDLPGLLFFSAYTLLILFWAEIYHQARSLPVNKLRPAYYSINGLVYFAQACLWISVLLRESHLTVEISKLFVSGKVPRPPGFCIGQRTRNKLNYIILYCIGVHDIWWEVVLHVETVPYRIKRPPEKTVRGFPLTLVLSTSWLCNSNLLYLFLDKMHCGEPYSVTLSAFDTKADLDVLDHPILNLIYYMLVEILPSALVLFILRKLPPKRVPEQYQEIR